MRIDGFEVKPLTPDRFEDLEAVLGKSGVGGCWCTYWLHPTSALWGAGTSGGSSASNRKVFHDIVDAGPPPGIIAYDDQDPVAWCRVMPRHVLSGLANSRFFKTDLDIDNVWSLACFVVRRPARRRGLTTVLTKAAIEFVRNQGGGVLEAYPRDTSEVKAESVVYTGVASTFLRLGFEIVQRRAPHKPMMRLAVAGSDQ